MPDLTPDQHAEKIRLKFSGPRDERRALHDALDALLALAKQGEAYDEALIHAHTLYTGQDESIEELAETIISAANNIPVGNDDKWGERRRDEILAALPRLVMSAHGDVPVEAFAAAMTALEQAEKERDEAIKARDAMLSAMEAEPPPPQIVDEVTKQTIGDLAADRDRLAAALEQRRAMIAEADDWLDGRVALAYQEQPLAQHWARVSKTVEEAGEAIEKLIEWTGQNPRKPQSDEAREDLLAELADVVVTATLAIQHFTKDAHETTDRLDARLVFLYERMRAADPEWFAREALSPGATQEQAQ